MTRTLILMFATTVAASTGAEAAPRKSAKCGSLADGGGRGTSDDASAARVGQPQRLFH